MASHSAVGENPSQGDSTGRSVLWLICIASAVVAVLLLFAASLSLPSFDPDSACRAAGRSSDTFVKTLVPPQAVCGTGESAVRLASPWIHAAIAGLCAVAGTLAIVPARRQFLAGRVVMATVLGIVGFACLCGVVASITPSQ